MEALIGSIIGAVCAIIGGLVSTLVSSYWQRKDTVLSALLPVRMDAFRQFEAAVELWSNSPTLPSACAAVYRASNQVFLVCSENTSDCLSAFTDEVKNAEETGSVTSLTELRLLHLELLHAMNYDLMHYQVPKIKTIKDKHKSKACQ